MQIKLDNFKNNPKIQLILMIKNLIKNTRWNNSVFLVGDLVKNMILGNDNGEIKLVIYYPIGGPDFAEWLAKTTDCYSVLKNPISDAVKGETKLMITSMPQYKDIVISCTTTRNSMNLYGTLSEDSATQLTSIDALYLDIQSENILDVWNCGIDDLRDGVIRGNTKLDGMLEKEPVRILDIFAQASKFGFNIEKDTWFTIIKHVKKLDWVSTNILKPKFLNILLSKNPSCGIERLRTSGALKYLIPELYDMMNIIDNGSSIYYHTLAALDASDANIVTRMSVLFHEIGKCNNEISMLYHRRFFDFERESAKIAYGIAKRLNFSEAEAKGIKTCIEVHTRFWDMDVDTMPSDRRIKRFIKDCDSWILQALYVIDADCKSQVMDKYKKPNFVKDMMARMKAIATAENEKEIEIPINGKDIMEKFKLKSSPLIGMMLDKVKNWCKNNDKLTKDECLEKLKADMVTI